jgi:hypothetical protein
MSMHESSTDRLMRIQASLGGRTAMDVDGSPDIHFERQEEMKRLISRRVAWEKDQAAPSVPDSLTTYGDAAEFVFLGYAKLGTPKEAYEAQVRASLDETTLQRGHTSCKNSSDDFDDLGVFINSVGEMWQWKPKDLAGRRAKLRQQARLVEGATSVDAVIGRDPHLIDSGDLVD